MKKLFLIIIICFITIVKAQTVSISYYPEGATSITNGFIIEDNLIKNQDWNYIFNYDINTTINNLSRINGENFVLNKLNNYLVIGKEWYIFDNEGKKHYYSNNYPYRLIDIVNELGLINEDNITLNLHANWQKNIESISFKNINKIKIGTITKLELIVNPVDANLEDLTWFSSDPNIITVDQSGIIKAIKEGLSTITVKTSRGKEASINVEVTNVNKVAEEEHSLICNGKTYIIKKGEKIKLNLPNATKNITWKSSNKKVISVNSNGVIKTKKEKKNFFGQNVEITITGNGLNDKDQKISNSCKIKVQKIKNSKIDINYEDTVTSLVPGDEIYLIPDMVPAITTSKEITYNSSDEEIATIDENGRLIAKKEGKVIITAKSSNDTTKKTVLITKPATNENYMNISNECKEKAYNNKKDKITVHQCIFNSSIGATQNLAITKDNVYINKNKSKNNINANGIMIINRKTGLLTNVYMQYTGHAQSFDVIGADNKKYKNDTIFINYFSKKNTNDQSQRGLATKEITGNEKDNSIIIPERAIAIKESFKGLTNLTKEEIENIEKITSIADDNDYAKHLTVSVDKSKNLIALLDVNNNLYIYKLSELFNSNNELPKKINNFNIKDKKINLQGIEIKGKYIYVLGDTKEKKYNKTEHRVRKHVINKYEISTGKKKQYTFETGKREESEGMAIYGKYIYVACKNNDSGTDRVNIYRIKGILS